MVRDGEDERDENDEESISSSGTGGEVLDVLVSLREASPLSWLVISGSLGKRRIVASNQTKKEPNSYQTKGVRGISRWMDR